MTYTVEEILRANDALRAGQFRRDFGSANAEFWDHADTVWLVVGCHGGAGASTVALGLAEQVGQCRVVDCAPMATSVLLMAAFTELGEQQRRMVGMRDQIRIERCLEDFRSVDEVPLPTPVETRLTIVDAGCPAESASASCGWVGGLCRDRSVPVVLVFRPTWHGFARVEACLGLFAAHRCVVVCNGAQRPAAQQMGNLTRRANDEGVLVGLAENRLLASGSVSERFPAGVLSSIQTVMKVLEMPAEAAGV
ncbi:MAG: hypothetical protein LBI99_07840 [Propionibacteriaceae bacterium]|nr:hypothetical protein [Propionibacteriaceae bacterium]